MIKNLIVNGCSYTAPNSKYQCWADCLQEKHQFQNYKNLAMGGAGNTYIAQSTIDFLRTENFNPTETLVLIMWSGISRLDFKISQERWQIITDTGYQFAPQHVFGTHPENETHYWVLSGGLASGSWSNFTPTRKLFESMYKNTDNNILCQQSLNNFYLLESYLIRNQYNFKFTSFINQWADAQWADCKFDVDCKSSDNFLFENWQFVDQQKNCFREYAHNINQLDDTFHPTGRAHQLFAQNFFEPIIEEYVK